MPNINATYFGGCIFNAGFKILSVICQEHDKKKIIPNMQQTCQICT